MQTISAIAVDLLNSFFGIKYIKLVSLFYALILLIMFYYAVNRILALKPLYEIDYFINPLYIWFYISPILFTCITLVNTNYIDSKKSLYYHGGLVPILFLLVYSLVNYDLNYSEREWGLCSGNIIDVDVRAQTYDGYSSHVFSYITLSCKLENEDLTLKRYEDISYAKELSSNILYPVSVYILKGYFFSYQNNNMDIEKIITID